MRSALSDQIHALWDELADFEASQTDEALDRLLVGLCRLVDAQNATWVGAVRMPDILPGDPIHGWRPRTVHHLYGSRILADGTQEQTKQLEAGSVDETTVRNVALAGQFRVNRLIDLAPAEWFDSGYYRRYYLQAGRHDAIWAAVPVNEDAEVYFGVYRDAEHGRFSRDDCETIGRVLRGLKWFHRQQLLGRGLLVASSPLTPVERKVLQGLLTGQLEKQIAAALGQSYHTTHEYVVNLYRKFGVKNRSALMALWLGTAA